MLDRSVGVGCILAVESRPCHTKNIAVNSSVNLTPNPNKLNILRDRFKDCEKIIKESNTMDDSEIQLFGIRFKRANLRIAITFFAAGAIGAHVFSKVLRLATIATSATYLALYVNEKSDTLIKETKEFIKDKIKDESIMAKISRFINNPNNAIYMLSIFGGILFGMIFL